MIVRGSGGARSGKHRGAPGTPHAEHVALLNLSLSTGGRPGAPPLSLRSPARELVRAITIARTRAPGLTFTQFLIFLTVAAEEGLRLNELGERTGESQATVSRSVAMLIAGRRGSGKPGYGLLVLLRDPGDGRGRRAALSDAGHRLLASIENAFQH